MTTFTLLHFCFKIYYTLMMASLEYETENLDSK